MTNMILYIIVFTDLSVYIDVSHECEIQVKDLYLRVIVVMKSNDFHGFTLPNEKSGEIVKNTPSSSKFMSKVFEMDWLGTSRV